MSQALLNNLVQKLNEIVTPDNIGIAILTFLVIVFCLLVFLLVKAMLTHLSE